MPGRALQSVVVATSCSIVLALPGTAVASCAGPTVDAIGEQVASGDGSVFVGEVVAGSGDRARLAVDEVWSGPDLAPTVTVRTGPEQLPWPLSLVLRSATSVDADLDLGERYLVATRDDFATDACSSFVVDDAALAMAPEDVRPSTAGATGGHRPSVFDTALGATIVTALLGVGSLLVWGRRLDREDDTPGTASGRLRRGALHGGIVGVSGGLLTEVATQASLQLFPTDVGIAGFGLAVGAPAAVVVGALTWWLRRPASRMLRLLLVAAPVILVGVAQVVVQWSAQ